MKDNKGKFKNEDVFFLLRYVITGNPVGAPVGEICDIIGRDTVIKRLKAAHEHISTVN